jgi:putative transposase
VSRFIEEHRGRFGVEPICRVLGVSASAYYQRKTGPRSRRAVEDERLLARIRELHAANYYAYGSRRMWKALCRAGEQVGRGRVERLMRSHGIQGAKRRGRPWRTTPPTRWRSGARISCSATSAPARRIGSGWAI